METITTITTIEQLLAAYKDGTLKDKLVQIIAATLSGANLSGANLSGATLLNTRAIYSAFTLHMSSRTDSLTGYITLINGEIVLMLEAGCWSGTPEEFRQRIADKKSEAEGVQYLAATAFIETCFNDDMAAGRWEYLKTWDEDHKKVEGQS